MPAYRSARFENAVLKIATRELEPESSRISHIKVYAGQGHGEVEIERIRRAIKEMKERDIVHRTHNTMERNPDISFMEFSLERPYLLAFQRMSSDLFRYEGRLIKKPEEGMQHDPTSRRDTVLSFYVK